MFVMGKDGECVELANPYNLSRSIGRHKPSASLRRMRDVATPEDRDSSALLPPPLPPYYRQPPRTLDDLKTRLTKEGLGEHAELAAAYAINSAIRAWLGSQPKSDKNKKQQSTAVLYKGVLASQLQGRDYAPPSNIENFNPQILFGAYDKLRAEWEVMGSRKLPGGVEDAYGYVQHINEKKDNGQ